MLIVTLLEALELGLIYSILALGVFLSFRTLNTPDLTVDGSIVTGAAISAVVCTAAADLDPAVQGVVCILGLVLSFLFGMGAGAITALLNTKLKIQPLLAGILVMLGIYSINLRIQGKANINLSSRKTIYSMMDDAMGGFRWSAIVLGVLIAAVVIILMYGFLKTRLGFALRATGDNEDMVRAAGISSDRMKLLGLSVSNGLVGLAGGMLAQYQGYSDVGMGTGYGRYRSGVGHYRRSPVRHPQSDAASYCCCTGCSRIPYGHWCGSLSGHAADRSQAGIRCDRNDRTGNGNAGREFLLMEKEIPGR